MHATSIARIDSSSSAQSTWLAALHTRRLSDVIAALNIPSSGAHNLPPQVLASWGITGAPSSPIASLARGEAWRIMGLSGEVARAEVFEAMHQMARHNLAIWSLWLWFEHDRLCVATWHDNAILHAELPIELPRKVALQRFTALTMPDDHSSPLDGRWRRQILEALDQSQLTARFYDDFVRARELLARTVTHAPGSKKEREALALTVLLRVIVLYFLQGRGALDGNRWFLHHQLTGARASGASFWETVLRPLFFGALSHPPHERSALAMSLGEIPFLNGGLFEPTPIERDHPAITWPDSVWSEVFDAFFERYSFVLSEPLPHVHGTHIDPEMLGRVFEGLMCQTHRGSTGAFYTPAALVSRMVTQSLSGHLASALGLPSEALHDLVAMGSLPTSIGQHPTQLQALARALSELRILDPAVGTGAFLIETLSALRRCWKGLHAAGYGGSVDVQTYAGVRTLVHEHLYGVDVNTTAVRLCELRVWLALLAFWPEDVSTQIHLMEPLPNLGHRLAIGDSLIGPHEHVMLDVRGAQRGWQGWRPQDFTSASVQRGCELIQALQFAYLGAHGAEKVEAQRRLEDEEREQIAALLEDRCTRHDHDIRALEKMAQSRDLFGDLQGLPDAAEAQLLMLYREREALSRRVTLARRGEHALTFCYAARFGAVMARGGFDLILTNPPWVRANAQHKQVRNLHGIRYQSAAGGLWEGASQQGVRATFGTQADLSALFIERSLELLRPGGRLCALVPAKLFRSLHGAAVRGVMARHHIVSLEDMSEATGDLFDAVTYPAVIEVEKRALSLNQGGRLPARRVAPTFPQRDTRVTSWRGAASHVSRRPLAALCLHGKDMREPWIIDSGAMAHLNDQLGKPNDALAVLGSFPALRPRRGVMTGHNATFCMSASRALMLCDGDEQALRTWTRPMVRGRDVRAWHLDPRVQKQRLLWPYQGGEVAALDALPRAMSAHFLSFEPVLRMRSDCRRGEQHPWRLFRVQEGIEGAKVIWRDLSLWAEAACDEGGMIPMNTAYYIPCDGVERAWLLTAWMNAWVTRVALHGLAERAQNGYRRHFAWTVASMKIPTRWARFIEGSPDPELAADCAFWRAHSDGPGLCEARLCEIMGVPAEVMLAACGELVRRVKAA